MARYLSQVQADLNKLSEWAVTRVLHIENVKADALAIITVTLLVKEAVLLPIYLQTASLIATTSVCSTSEMDINWMCEIETYLSIGELLEEEKQTYKIRGQVAHFTLIRDNLYRQYFEGPYLKCLNNPEAQYVLVELHEGVYDNHAGKRTLAPCAHL